MNLTTGTASGEAHPISQPASGEGGERKACGLPLRVSVIIPVLNGGSLLAECIRAVRQSSSVWEIIVVDDGSSDGSADLARRLGCKVFETSGRTGPAAARNLGASRASADVLFFIDADVVVRPGVIERIVAAFEESSVHGVIGVQDPDMRFSDACSRYKNLWMYHTYAVRSQGDVPLFYTTAAAIRREVFLAAGGFDVNYTGPNIEDTDFGQKLASRGYRVVVDPSARVEHVKGYNLRTLLLADWSRSVALVRLKLRKRRESLASNDTSVPLSYILSVPVVLLGSLLLVLGLVGSWSAGILVGVISLLAAWAMNARFLAVLARNGGVNFLFKGMGIIVLELLVVGAACVWGMLSFLSGRSY